MKTSVLTMVMMAFVSMNINAKTNNDSWRNSNKKNNTTVVIVNDTHRHGAVDRKADKHRMDRHHGKMHRHHDCILVKDGKKTYVCKVCGARYKDDKHRR